MAHCKASFTVEPDLIGLVIGAGGSNIKKAQQIPGILNIHNNGAGKFYLSGETADAIQKARGMLELKSELFSVPIQFAGKIIGKSKKNIMDIKSKSLVHKIFVIGGNEATDDDVFLKIIGTSEGIENAKLLLNDHLCRLKNGYEHLNNLLSDAAAKKSICLSLTKRDCQNPTCQDLHLQHGVPYLWQIKLNGKWTSFLSNQNFQIEYAYCSLDDKFIIKDFEYEGFIYCIEVSFMKCDQDMYASVQHDTNKNRAEIRRLCTASFGDRTLNADSYLTQWRWYWRDDNGVWLLYEPDLLIHTLEVKFLKNQKTYLFSRKNYTMKYRLSFDDMKQTNLKTWNKRDILRRPLFISKRNLEIKTHPPRIVGTAIELFGEESKPSHFYPWDLANEFELVELDKSEYTEVFDTFNQTMKNRNYGIKYIYRVQNKELWSEYQLKKKHMQAGAYMGDIDERNLFHGTDGMDSCRGICINNFDFRKNGKNGTSYGHGSYFARDAKYSHKYANPSKSGDRYMFRAKVLVGRFTKGESDYHRPPEFRGKSHKLYDSCVDKPENPSIFVIFDTHQSYPEYLIIYSKAMIDMKTCSSTIRKSPSYTTYSSKNRGGSSSISQTSRPRKSSAPTSRTSMSTIYPSISTTSRSRIASLQELSSFSSQSPVVDPHFERSSRPTTPEPDVTSSTITSLTNSECTIL